MNKLMPRLVFLCVAVVSYYLDSYDYLLFAFSGYLITTAITTEKINEKFFSYFFFGYLFLPFLNISEYRGTVGIETLAIYCSVQFLFLLLLAVFEKKVNRAEFSIEYECTPMTELVYSVHMAAVYAAVAYIYLTIGPIVIRQDLRFNIPPSIEYFIKSGLVLPLFWVYFDRHKISVKSVAYKFLVPIIPSLLIGSRGTFMIVLIAILISLYLFGVLGPKATKRRYSWFYENSRMIAFVGLFLALFALYSGFYIRRDGVDLITADDAISEYGFVSDGIEIKAILPLYMGLRETVGLTHRIIEDDIENLTEVPLFYSELLTFLPGHQVAPGIVLAVDIYRAQGSDEKYSLTPGIVGGVYLDYKYWFFPIISIFALLIVVIYNVGLGNMKWRLLYVLTLVQFFHLYHRGFMKLEYFVPYVILFCYFATLVYFEKKSKRCLDA